MFNKACDWDRGAGMSVIWDQTKSCKMELRDCAIQLSKTIRTVGGAANDSHRFNIVGLELAC